jgi:hypothetical protein
MVHSLIALAMLLRLLLVCGMIGLAALVMAIVCQ